ncbi:MAG TPA: hypothetical protein PLZ53_08955 [Candidatus Hydrogenedentes bacterium]|jgi:hypothetical protein|nr:hypothetical protein [Candidatus Hydrogenedentota bacterium]HOH43236.1 hypothetical protein [Candidatus Hydrogenedentota bacterium]HPX85185.1 hypothetical protein [Candidatus Hydrogenedentota bacterium]HQB02110.1 hypothetical protein [Candidatus Hydrogenedentota bacterium]
MKGQILLLLLPVLAATASEEHLCEAAVPLTALTQTPAAHWFGYYDKFQFDPSDRYVLVMEVSFEDRAPTAEDAVALGMIDLQENNRWIPLGSTTAWCWQQGCMLQWLPGSDSEIIYNIREDQDYAAVIQNVFTGEQRRLPKPVYTVNPDGTEALGLNFTRLGDTRPGYGYNGFEDPPGQELYPDSEGIYRMDLRSGEWKTIITLNQIALAYGNETTDQGKHWFNHLLYNPDGSRFIFLHRWHKENRKGRFTQGFTAAPDGRDIFCFNDNGMVSHFIWRNTTEILAWSAEKESGNKFHRYFDRSNQVEVVAPDILLQDGHCTWSPCGNWILTDTYPDKEQKQTLFLYRPADGKRIDLGRFYQERPAEEQLRCDLHPRWNRAGTQICIDSRCSGQRQLYLLDVSDIVRNQE